MNNIAPELSGLVPYIVAFIAVAEVGAIVALVIIGQKSPRSSRRTVAHAWSVSGRPSGVALARAPLR